MVSTERPSLLAPFLEAGLSETAGPGSWRPFLSIQLRTGPLFSIRYEHLLWVFLVNSGEIVLRFSSHTVRLKGRNLSSLHDELMTLKAGTIVELDPRYDVEENIEPVVTAVSISPTRDGDDLIAERLGGE